MATATGDSDGDGDCDGRQRWQLACDGDSDGDEAMATAKMSRRVMLQATPPRCGRWPGMAHPDRRSTRRTPFHLLEVGLQAIERLRPVVGKLERRDGNLAHQLRKALTAAPLLAAEGNRARKNNRTAKLEAAGAEAAEAAAALRVAMAWNYVTWIEIERGMDDLDHFQAIVRRLTS